MSTSTTVSSLKIHTLTKAQYDEIQNPSDTELYLVPDTIDSSPTSGSGNPVSSGGVYTALSGKANSNDLATVATSGSYNDLSNKPTIPDITGKEDVTAIVAQSTAISTLTAEVGKYYRLDVPVETLAITLPTMTSVTNVKTITFYMTGGTTPGVTWTSTHNVYLADFTIESGKTYEVNAAWNGASWIVAAVGIVISNSNS